MTRLEIKQREFTFRVQSVFGVISKRDNFDDRVVEGIRMLASAVQALAEIADLIAAGTAHDAHETRLQSLQRAEIEAEAQSLAGIPDDEARAFLDTVRNTTPEISDNSGYANDDRSIFACRPPGSRVDNFESALRDRYGDRLGVDHREIALFAVNWFHVEIFHREDLET